MAENDLNSKYLEFASNISFFEFIQKEFKEPHFKVEKNKEEIREIISKGKWNVNDLAKFIREHPKSFEIFEEIFQLKRFTNTQLIHFMFDTKTLNSANEKLLIEYLLKNINSDEHFYKLFIKLIKKNEAIGQSSLKTKDETIKFIKNSQDPEIKEYLIMALKATIIKYVQDSTKKHPIIHGRIKNSNLPDVSKRTAEYIINNLDLNNVLKGINLENYLKFKRVPIDTKSIHGNFGKIKLQKILEKNGFINADKLVGENIGNTISRKLELSEEQEKLLKEKFAFLTERTIKGIKKSKDNKPKKFDFILLYDLKPKILIETNFYSTAGTKIGINQNEYVDLNNEINQNFKHYTFMWVTDGNYWLLPVGKNRFLNLIRYFGDNILNYNLLDKKLSEIKEKMRR